jgi:hypothetical protein
MKKLTMLLLDALTFARRRTAAGPAIGVGTVRTIGDERQVFIEVVAVSGETFIGRLARSESDPDLSMLRPGLVVLVAFDPAAREELSLPDDVLAVHASWLASV